MFVIGKAKKKNKDFKKYNKILCRYQSQRKTWMESVLFEEQVRGVNKKFQAEGKKKKQFFVTKYYISESADGSRCNRMSQASLQETVSKGHTVQSQFQ